MITYANSDTSGIPAKFFFRKGHAEVSLISSPHADQYYSIDEKSSVNIIPYSEMGGTTFESFIKETGDTLVAFYHRNKRVIVSDTAVNRKVFVLSDSVTAKRIEFIRRFPDLYISFWIFVTNISKTNLLSPEKLMEFYTTVLPDKYKSSKVADHTTSLIRNKIAVSAKDNFPAFSAVDMHNNKIESSKLRGNYVLIQFWASWCIPCMAEMPDLKKINDQYGATVIKLISFSIDNDLSACRKAIEKHSMNWTQVMGDKRLYNSLGYTSIPQVFLIDKTGRTIYNRDAAMDYDLVQLKKLLAEHLDK